jgi:hypothetical protein
VGDVVSTSKGEATNGLSAIWGYTKQDFTNAHTPLTSITASHALGDVNMALQLMIIAISNINGGISYSCATGLVPGQPLPMFNTHTFAMEGKNGGGGSQNLTADQLAQQIQGQGVDEVTATSIALYAEEQGLNLSDIQNMLDTMVNGGGDAELSTQQMQQWVENGTIAWNSWIILMQAYGESRLIAFAA